MTTLQEKINGMSPYDIGSFDPPKPRPKPRRPFKWVIRGIILAIVGYAAGVGITLAIRGGDPTDEIAVIAGYILALFGWLAGVGGIEAFGR
ncbi:MAG: hypothetical protein ACR2N2_06955, partial [Acidimicrobiia bacterium]